MTDRLPIYEIEREIIARLKTGRRLILSAPTGSGKSTQVPQMLFKHGLLGDGQVVILQPRRLATRLLASRVAQELGVQLGSEVGYQIRFENVTSPRTKIRFVTEGVLLRQMIDDPKLRGVSVLIFDEFHERHLYGDITLARALELQQQHRPDLNLIVMSATLDVELLEDYLSERRPPARRDEVGVQLQLVQVAGRSLNSNTPCRRPALEVLHPVLRGPRVPGGNRICRGAGLRGQATGLGAGGRGFQSLRQFRR